MAALMNGPSSLTEERGKPCKYFPRNEAIRIKLLKEKSMVESVECSREVEQ